MASSQSDLHAAAMRIEAMQEHFASAPHLQSSFDRANTATQPIEVRPAEPEYDGPDRAGLEGTSLAGAPDIGKSFDDASVPPSEPQQPSPAATSEDRGDERGGSQMVRDSQPSPDLVPPDSPERRAVDREAFDAKWDAEHARFDEAAARIESMQADQGLSHDHDMGIG